MKGRRPSAGALVRLGKFDDLEFQLLKRTCLHVRMNESHGFAPLFLLFEPYTGVCRRVPRPCVSLNVHDWSNEITYHRCARVQIYAIYSTLCVTSIHVHTVRAGQPRETSTIFSLGIGHPRCILSGHIWGKIKRPWNSTGSPTGKF